MADAAATDTPTGGSAGDGAPAGSSGSGSVTIAALRADVAAFAAEREWQPFHTPRNLLLALTGEVGELAECFQWRGDADCAPGLPTWSAADKHHLGEELSDVRSCVLRCSRACARALTAPFLRRRAGAAVRGSAGGPLRC